MTDNVVMIRTRADRNNNPAAITTDLARQGGLRLGVEYLIGDSFPNNPNLHTAKLVGDPIALTERVIDEVGYYTKQGALRWTYIALPKFVWDSLATSERREVIGFHYKHEGGTELQKLFQNG